jgi:hypothetical protein
MIYDNPKVRKHDTIVLTIESLNIFDEKIAYAHTLDIKQESLRMPERRSCKFFATASLLHLQRKHGRRLIATFGLSFGLRCCRST